MKHRLARAYLVLPFGTALVEAATATLIGMILAVATVLSALVCRDLFRAGGVL